MFPNTVLSVRKHILFLDFTVKYLKNVNLLLNLPLKDASVALRLYTARGARYPAG